MEFWNFRKPNRLQRLARGFIIPFRAIFIFGASQSELSIKSYSRLKFFRPKSMINLYNVKTLPSNIY